MPAKKRHGGKTLGQGRHGSLHDLELPSSETCRARRPGVPGLIAAGVLDSFDQLTSLVQTVHVDKNTLSAASAAKVTTQEQVDAAKAMLADQEKLSAGFEMIDKLVAYVVVMPPVWVDYQMKGETDAEFAARAAKAEEDEAVAVTDVDLDDKMFLMNWSVGGSADVTTFRKKLAESVADMADVSGVQVSAVGTDGGN